MQHVPAPNTPAVTRRTALVASGGLALAAGTTACTVRSPLEARPTETATPAPLDPDLALRDRALLAIATQGALVTSTLKVRPRLTARLTPLQTLHQAHAAALPEAEESAPARVPAGTWATVLQGERTLQRQLASFAQQAESGGFARLLASMSAGVAQALAGVGAR